MSDKQGRKTTDRAGGTQNEGANSNLTPFQTIWGEYVHRVKVHELLRCLEVEQKKLRVLRENLNIRDIKADKNVDKSRDATAMENRVVFQHPLEEEEKSSELIGDEIRLNKTEQNYVSKSVIRLFDINQSITNEQFERIMELCKDDQERRQLQEAYQEKRAREKYLHNASEVILAE
ncbi:unnamed protein product [Allacma fusca]|uniref:Uncharacterized protein n=1 Tax=Allacma fusca TaxID=39272 RepID=A0A8J2KT13_9HEXA|nr:unnamed protein product [Allacma fusca]